MVHMFMEKFVSSELHSTRSYRSLTLHLISLMASKSFRFLVGAEKTEFMMHSNLVANMSDPLNTLVNGSMKEAREGVA